MFCVPTRGGFYSDGIFNQHNTYVWSDENPHAMKESGHQQQFSLNVWAGILGDRLIGPHILPRRLNGDEYLAFLRHELSELLEDVPLETRQQMWYLHDDAPAHSARIVAQYLSENYRDRWIGRKGPIRLPARSPDLNPCDFFLWGAMKQTVYNVPMNNIQQLRERIDLAAQEIRDNPNIFARVHGSMLRRVHAYIENRGRHFEHLL